MSVPYADRFSSLIGEIYDAAMDPAQRGAVLGQVTRFVGGCAALIISRDAAGQSIEIHQTFGIDGDLRQVYRDRFVEQDPLLWHHDAGPKGQVISVADVMPLSQFHLTSFHRDWVAPQDAIDLASVALERSETRITVLHMLRHRARGVVDDTMIERLRLFAPHISRALTLGRQVRARAHGVNDLAAVLDHLSTAVCLLDADGRVVHANAAGYRLFADADLVALVGDRIVPRTTQADRIFRSLLEIGAQGTPTADERSRIDVATASDGQHYLLRLVTLKRECFRARDMAASALFIHKVAMLPALAPGAIAAAFRLTPSELRVLMAIVEVGGVPDISAKLGIAETTVKTHLGRLFEKMDAGRQADLVRIAAGFAAPFVEASAPVATACDRVHTAKRRRM
jgi:DNA-binding CsgD family transcriptional regulator/PAS domain-containing protein